jgi:hypothetical protein
MSEAEGEALPPVWRRRYAAMCFIWDVSGVQEGICRQGQESSSSVVEYLPPLLSGNRLSSSFRLFLLGNHDTAADRCPLPVLYDLLLR